MPIQTHLKCIWCSFQATIASGLMRCTEPECGGLLEVVIDYGTCKPERAVHEKKRFRARRRSDAPEDAGGVWRFREYVLPHLDASRLVTRGAAEGNTPLLRFARSAEYAGVADVQFKHEGYNGTGSFKDRGMTAAVSAAVQAGATLLACASTGNTAASMSSYAALAGLPALVLLPEGAVAVGKIAQTLAYGGQALMVRGTYDQSLALLGAVAEQMPDLAVMNSLNPLRLEGQKTIIWEMLEQRGWEPPDWIVVPGGNLGNAAAFHKALMEAVDFGWIKRLPKLAIIQADGASPLARAWPAVHDEYWRLLMRRGNRRTALALRMNDLWNGKVAVEPVARPYTVASAIRIGAPVNMPKAIRALFETNGACTSVSDVDIQRAKLVLDRDGIGAEPSSATALAGLRALREQGRIRASESVVCVLTGHVLKAADHITASLDHADPALRLPNPPITIHSRDDLARIIRDLPR